MNRHCLTIATILVAVAGCVTDESTLAPPAQQVSRSQQPDADPSAPRPFTIEGQLVVKPRAVVNGIPILDDELRQATYQPLAATERLSEPERSERRKEIVRAELEKLVERELIMWEALARLGGKKQQALDKLQEAAGKEFDKYLRTMKERAKQQGIKVDSEEELKALMEQQGLSLDALRRQTERSFMAMEYMRHLIFPAIEKGINHSTIRQYYDEHPGEFQTEDHVKWQDIFIAIAKYPSQAEARKKVEEIIARAQKGEDFLALSKQHDDGDSMLFRQGNGLGEKRGEIQPRDVEPILFRMREGEVGPIVENANGYHIVKLVEREYADLHPFDEKTQGDIKKKLQGIIADREYKRIVNQMKNKAMVQFVED